MENELIKYILELIDGDDCLCVELKRYLNEYEYCTNNCSGLNESCVRRLMYNRMFN